MQLKDVNTQARNLEVNKQQHQEVNIISELKTGSVGKCMHGPSGEITTVKHLLLVGGLSS